MNELVVEVKNLSRRFGNTLALDNVSFEAGRGLVYGLVGANGAGKTTLIKHIMGLLRCKSGSVRVFGLNPVHEPVNVLGNIGYLSEDRDLPDWMSITELMNYTHACYPNWDQTYGLELLDTFGLDPSKRIKELSRGMRAQAALITAVAHRPQLLVLDEPSSGLDAVVRKDILNAIVRTISDDGRTVIFSSHFLDEVERMSDHVTMIQQGQVALDGSLEQLISTYHCTSIRFVQPIAQFPHTEIALRTEGSGRFWSVTHTGTPAELLSKLTTLHGEIVESRQASLEEIFIARIGDAKDKAVAA